MLEKLLSEKKASITKKWFEAILATYPDDTQRFLKGQKNRFANPVGHTISQGIEALFEQLLHGIDPEKTSIFLDNVIRIRAVQDFSPSQATAFIFQLKQVIRDELKSEIRQGAISDELSIFESRIDELALLAFDIYTKCRERLHDIRANQMRRSTMRLLKKTDFFYDISQQEPNSEDVNHSR